MGWPFGAGPKNGGIMLDYQIQVIDNSGIHIEAYATSYEAAKIKKYQIVQAKRAEGGTCEEVIIAKIIEVDEIEP